MATHLRDNAAIDSAVEIVDAIAGGLESDPATAPLAPVWIALVLRGDALAASLRTQRRLARRARTAVNVADAVWDPDVKAFTRAILDIAQGKRDSADYQRFFRGATSTEIVHYGIDREVQAGRGFIAELGTYSPGSSLNEVWVPRLTRSTDALQRASEARRAAVTAMGPLLTAQFLYVEDVNLEIDRLEGQLQMQFPGDPGRVASYLSATRRDDAGVPDAAPASPTPAG